MREKRGQPQLGQKKRQKVRHFAKDKPICLLESSVSYFFLFFIIFECSCLQSYSVSVATQIDIYLILFGAHGLTKRDEATTSYVVLREKVLPKPIETHDGGK